MPKTIHLDASPDQVVAHIMDQARQENADLKEEDLRHILFSNEVADRSEPLREMTVMPSLIWHKEGEMMRTVMAGVSYVYYQEIQNALLHHGDIDLTSLLPVGQEITTPELDMDVALEGLERMFNLENHDFNTGANQWSPA